MNLSINKTITTSLLDSFGIIQIAGEDNVKFLQGQATVNVEKIQPNELALGSVCNPQGRCVSLFFICRVDDAIFLIMRRDTIETTITNLRKYAIFFKVEILDCSEQYKLHGFGNISSETSDLDNYPTIAFWKDKHIAISITHENSDTHDNQINSDKVTNVSEASWLYTLANLKISWLTKESQSQFLPHNLGLPQLAAVDFKKGCFTGQEVIARMQYKGKLKSHIQLFFADQALEIAPLSSIYADEKNAAQVICSAQSDKNQTAILAVMKDRYLESKIFRWNDEKGPILEFTSLK